MLLPSDPRTPLSRRAFLSNGSKLGLGAVGLGLAGRWLSACSTSSPLALISPSPGSVAAAVRSAANGTASTWATGGTAGMLASYPDPFASDTSSACSLTTALTVGPCYANTLLRKDVSEGLPGLPVRLSFRVLDASCQPVANATVDIWHTNASGVYSAYATGTICDPGSDTAAQDATKAHFMRGVQTTDANGRVDFDTVFPGWYASRTVHIHFTVRIGATAEVTSQFFFQDTLTDEIYADHPEYDTRAKRDTTNVTDSVLPQTGQDAFILATARMTDGVLQAYKTITIKTTT